MAAGSDPETTGESMCGTTSHAHQYGDVRMAVIEISSVNQCGFSFIDLEEQTVGLDNSFQFASDFEVVRIDQSKEKSSAFEKVQVPRKAVKKGMRVIAVYCGGAGPSSA